MSKKQSRNQLEIVKVTGDVQIDVSLIPEHVCDSLVAPLPQIVRDYFKLPGVKEDYQEWLKEYEKRPKIVKQK